MNKIIAIAFVLSLFCTISCKKEEGEINGKYISFKENEVHKKLYLMDKVRSQTLKLKSFEDEDREL